ncbi:3,4-dihydroxyphenylacetaldehyde synthase [Pseudolycoriella hygida]|uniref:3,4-dihydroxyphenylacetaldehyde synthase n=1 Tax=Pseudolycoriella hygida TaxID=35572 RepID=A0A9Q0S7T3_9DIPT|nr:3,4-dihydroxyphenylacetaldehyde synthase [Pseudolycoriella hygida]
MTLVHRPVLPSVSPGYLHKLIPEELPEKAEDWKCIMKDIERVIMPGMTHWQSPNFHAFYPAPTSYPSIIGEMISAAFGTVGFSWICSPACTELEVIMMDWLGRFLGLPETFLRSSGGTGGGVIQGAASEAILIAVLTAREQKVQKLMRKYPELTESEIRGKLVAYSSDQSNSAIEKAGILAAVPMRLIPADKDNQLTGQLLQSAIDEDLLNGKFPVICIATFGTTGTCSFDKVHEIGPICNENDIWLHIDAAYAGAALCCPEYRPLMTGIEWANSFNFNLHKWMMVNFDCCAMWFKNSHAVIDAFTVNRIYLDHKHQGASDRAPDYRHWTINLGRRFRSIKVWIVLRTLGAEKLRAHIRGQTGLAEMFENMVRSDERFEIVCKRTLGLVCFRLKGECSLTKTLLDQITARKQLFMIHATFDDKLMIRFVICGHNPNEKDMLFAWNEVKTQADILFSVKEVTENLNNKCAISTQDFVDKQRQFSSCVGDIQQKLEKVK